MSEYKRDHDLAILQLRVAVLESVYTNNSQTNNIIYNELWFLSDELKIQQKMFVLVEKMNYFILLFEEKLKNLEGIVLYFTFYYNYKCICFI